MKALLAVANLALHQSLRRPLRKFYLRIVNTMKHGDPYYPGGVTIQTSTLCNRRCAYCPVSKHPATEQKIISPEMLKRITFRLNEFGYTGTVDFIHYNEPLLCEVLEERIAIVKHDCPKTRLVLTTNGDCLNEIKARRLINLGIEQFNVTRHPPYSDVWDTQIRLVMSRFPRHVHFLESPGQEGWSNRGGLVEIPGPNCLKTEGYCTSPEFLTILMNGDVPLCCNDFFGKYVLGNVDFQTLESIYYNRDFMQLRAELRHGIARIPMCRACLEK